MSCLRFSSFSLALLFVVPWRETARPGTASVGSWGETVAVTGQVSPLNMSNFPSLMTGPKPLLRYVAAGLAGVNYVFQRHADPVESSGW